MSAIRRRVVEQTSTWLPQVSGGRVLRAVAEIHSGVRRLPASPRPGDAEPELPRAIDSAQYRSLGDVLVQIGEPAMLREDVVGSANDPADADDVFYDGPAPHAWLGRLICMLTALTTGTALMLLAFA